MDEDHEHEDQLNTTSSSIISRITAQLQIILNKHSLALHIGTLPSYPNIRFEA